MNRVLLDQGLAPGAAMLLRADGWDAVLHAHLAQGDSEGPTVVLIRLEGLRAAQQAELIRRVWSACGDEIAAGAAVSVDAARIRFRKLPLR